MISLRRITIPAVLGALFCVAWAGSARCGEQAWKFAVVSDLHIGQVDPAKKGGAFLDRLVSRLIAERVDLVVLTGDLTRGNPDDKAPVEEVRKWWQNLHAAIKPLQAAGIPVVPLPGNHDQYTAAHRQAYAEAWEDFAPALSSFSVQGAPPQHYSFTHKNVHFTQLTIVDQYISPEQEEWLKKDLARAAGAGLRFVFGHVPMDSALLGKPSVYFRKQMSAILAAGQAAAYISGHEHLNWDQVKQFKDWPVRQIITGTAMEEPYNYPVRRALTAKFCRPCDGLCMMPSTRKHFETDPKTRLQRLRQTFYMLEINPALKDGYAATPYTLDAQGQLAPFYSEAGAACRPGPRSHGR